MILTFIYLVNKKEEKNYLDFSISEKNTFGSSHWMSVEDIKKDSDLEIGELREVQGIILGKLKNNIVCQNKNGSLNKNIFAVGMAGSGKSTGFIIPYIYQSIKNNESVIAIDTKGDIYSQTVSFAVSHNYTIRVLNCRDPEYSDCWNMLSSSIEDPNKIKSIAETIYDCTGSIDEGNEDFWRNSSLLLFQALIYYVIEMNKSSDTQQTIGQVYKTLIDFDIEDTAINYIKKLFFSFSYDHPDHPAVELFKSFNAASKNDIKNSIIQNLTVKLSLFENKIIQKMLGGNDIDLTLPARDRCLYYINLSEYDHTSNMIATIFFREMTKQLLFFADSQKDKKCPIPVTLLLDEFGAIGRLPNFDDFIAGSRSRNIRCVLAFQNYDQIKQTYSNGAETILANCEIWISTGINDLNTAELFSRAIGTSTVENLSESYPSQLVSTTTNVTRAQTGRRLIDEAEIMRISKSKNLVFVSKKFPLLLEKVNCWKMDEYNYGEKLNILNYQKDKRHFKYIKKKVMYSKDEYLGF